MYLIYVIGFKLSEGFLWFSFGFSRCLTGATIQVKASFGLVGSFCLLFQVQNELPQFDDGSIETIQCITPGLLINNDGGIC